MTGFLGLNARAVTAPGGVGFRMSGLSTPQPGQRYMQQQAAAPAPVFERAQIPTFSDGEVCSLRHAPRKRMGTGEKLAAPATPASIPKHWNNPAPGEKPKPPPEDPVPSFNKWRKIRKSGEARAVPGGDAQDSAVGQPAPMTPGLPTFAVSA